MRPRLLLALLVVVACGKDRVWPKPETSCTAGEEWTQWGRNAAHAGATCARGQTLSHLQVDLTVDPFTAQETAETGGDLLAHYQAPLISGDDVFYEAKEGNYVSCSPPGSGSPAGCGTASWSSEVWTVHKATWSGGQLGAAWSYASDWKPPPDGPTLNGWEPVFHAALAPQVAYLPGANGSVLAVARDMGALVERLDPFPGDALSTVAGPVAVDPSGAAVWTVVRFSSASDPWGQDAQGYVVRASPGAAPQTVSFAALLPEAPSPSAACEQPYVIDPQNPPALPLMAGGQVVPSPAGPCGSQRPAINVAPAIAADGSIVVVSRAHQNERYAYVVALNPDLTRRWATSLRGILGDGCGFTVPRNNLPAQCRPDAPLGVDPFTGTQPAGRASDASTASPVALPDGSVLYGTYSYYNAARGHLFKLDSTGKPVALYGFGWDTTPAWFAHGGTYSIVTKDNHYEGGGPYLLVQLDANLNPEWTFQSDNRRACARQPDGSIACGPEQQVGFEWCVNAVAVDADGTVFANSEDGFLYAVAQGGHEKARLFLNQALGAAYTPLTLDAKGRIYTQNAGHLYVVGADAAP